MARGAVNAVVAGVDGSREGVDAAQWAAAQAHRSGSPLRLVHCYPVRIGAASVLVGGAAGLRSIQRDHGHTVLAEAEKAIRAAFPHLVIEPDVVEGAPVRRLVEESRSARLVVVGAHGVGGFGGMLVGSVTEGVALHGHSPTVVVRGRSRGDAPPSQGPVVVGTDGSAASGNAMRFAFEQASGWDVPLVAVRTWNDVLLGTTGMPSLQVDPAEVDSEVGAELAAEIAGWQQRYPQVVVHQVVERGRPVRTLVKLGDQAQLLVVGSRGQESFPGMLLGSTSRALVTYAPCSLAVVRAAETDED